MGGVTALSLIPAVPSSDIVTQSCGHIVDSSPHDLTRELMRMKKAAASIGTEKVTEMKTPCESK
jgi:hypothetical protein